LTAKKNVRLLEIPAPSRTQPADLDFRRVAGGLLVQERDPGRDDIMKAKVATKRTPTKEEYQALDFAWRVVKNVKIQCHSLCDKRPAGRSGRGTDEQGRFGKYSKK